MLIQYIRRNRAVHGVLVAELRGTNIFVGYSLLHEKDFQNAIIDPKLETTKPEHIERILAKQVARLATQGFNFREKRYAVRRALAREQFDIFDTKSLYPMIANLMPDFIKRCVACFEDATTINGFDIDRDSEGFVEFCNAGVAEINKYIDALMEIRSDLRAAGEAGIREGGPKVMPILAVFDIVAADLSRSAIRNANQAYTSLSGKHRRIFNDTTQEYCNNIGQKHFGRNLIPEKPKCTCGKCKV